MGGLAMGGVDVIVEGLAGAVAGPVMKPGSFPCTAFPRDASLPFQPLQLPINHAAHGQELIHTDSQGEQAVARFPHTTSHSVRTHAAGGHPRPGWVQQLNLDEKSN